MFIKQPSRRITEAVATEKVKDVIENDLTPNDCSASARCNSSRQNEEDGTEGDIGRIFWMRDWSRHERMVL